MESLEERARNVLSRNDLGSSTKPSPDLYPHQWNWDSCFISIGISHYDSARAEAEIRTLLRAQWRNGLVPQIVFNPNAAGYFPGPDVWQSQLSPDAPDNIQTSGITQPPILATAALQIYLNSEERGRALGFLEDVYDRISAYHRFLYRERNPDGGGLVVVLHPWESGLDNSPPYLDAGSRVRLTYKPQYTRLDTLHVSAKNRPSDKDYDLFVYLLEQMRSVHWDQARYLRTAPLQVEDVLVNSVLCRANADLAEIAELIGKDTSEALGWKDMTAAAINEKLWDEDSGTYYSFDRVAGHLLKDDTIAALHTLYGRAAPPDRAERLLSGRLVNGDQYWPPHGFPIPTTAMDSPWFNPSNYWLGPTWVNTNWMVAQGLQAYGRTDIADSLRMQTLDLVAQQGFREYFNPLTGEGYGTDAFSWTAALSIDMISRMSSVPDNQRPGSAGQTMRRG